MRTYEALYIVSPDLEDDAIQTIAKDVESLVVNHEGAVVRSEIWGKRKLAYEVKKRTEGVYVLLRFQANPDVVSKLESYFKLADAIIRSLIAHFDEHTLRLEAEQNQRREEELRSAPAGRDGDRDRDRDGGRDGGRDRDRGPRRHRDDDDDDDRRPRRPRGGDRDEARPPRRPDRSGSRPARDAGSNASEGAEKEVAAPVEAETPAETPAETSVETPVETPVEAPKVEAAEATEASAE